MEFFSTKLLFNKIIMNVKVFRMSSGEDVVADVLEDKEDSLVIMNPIVAFNQGDGRLGCLMPSSET